MGLTVTKKAVYVIGDRKEVLAEITFDSSYPTGGEALSAADLGLDIQLDYISSGVAAKGDGSLAVIVDYDYTNGKLQAFKSNTAANPQEVADTASLATYVCRLRAVGKGSASA